MGRPFCGMVWAQGPVETGMPPLFFQRQVTSRASSKPAAWCQPGNEPLDDGLLHLHGTEQCPSLGRQRRIGYSDVGLVQLQLAGIRSHVVHAVNTRAQLSSPHSEDSTRRVAAAAISLPVMTARFIEAGVTFVNLLLSASGFVFSCADPHTCLKIPSYLAISSRNGMAL